MTAIYNQIGGSYNSTRKADPKIVGKILTRLQPVSGGSYLDLACGTGNYTLEYKRAGLNIMGIDQSDLMIERAKARDLDVDWRVGEAEDLPFKNGSFDGVACTNAIHHFQDLGKMARECFRVLTSGRLVIFCSTQEQMQKYWLNRYFPEMMKKSLAQMPTRNGLLHCLKNAGFENISCEPFFVAPDLQDLFLYSAKQRPELYLNEEFRKNISSFASLSTNQEVDAGLEKLSVDIGSGIIQDVVREFESNLGDYLIVFAEKTR